jgi:hypothetical protein
MIPFLIPSLVSDTALLLSPSNNARKLALTARQFGGFRNLSLWILAQVS